MKIFDESLISGVKTTMKRKSEKEQRKRTNIDTPTEMPELWEGDVPEQCLDPAERSREELIGVGDDVSADKDIEVRERGGGQLIIPSGEKGTVIRDEKADGLCLNVRFPAMNIEAIVPKRMLKKKGQAGPAEIPETIVSENGTATTDQVKKQVREMLREGYQKVDIESTMRDLYPEHAEEALKGLN